MSITLIDKCFYKYYLLYRIGDIDGYYYVYYYIIVILFCRSHDLYIV